MVQKRLRNDTRELRERNRQTDSVVIRRQKKKGLYISVCEQKLWRRGGFEGAGRIRRCHVTVSEMNNYGLKFVQ